MPAEVVDEFDDQDGSKLRKQLEATLKENRELKTNVVRYRTKEVISEGKYSLVKPEDLEGIDVDKLEDRAKELQTQRFNQRESMAKEIFASQGYEDDDLDTAVKQFLGGEAPAPTQDPDAEKFERVRSLGNVNSQPLGRKTPSDLTGLAALEHGLAQREKRKR